MAVIDAALVSNEPASKTPPDASAVNDSSALDVKSLSEELDKLVGSDSDFELQTADAPPAAPWNAGPNSVVRVMPRAQSPARELFSAGTLGVHMPNRAQYDGFGSILTPTWKSDTQEKLYASFDFRCADASAGGDGSWRFYIGHGPGNSAAVELFFNAHTLFARSGDKRASLGTLRVGQWYQVQLELRLKDRQYRGTVKSLDGEPQQIVCDGDFATGWDGTIDYTFIDSYGHIGGVRPALDADNYIVSTALPQANGTTATDQSDNKATDQSPSLEGKISRPQRVAALRAQLVAAKESLASDAERLQRELAAGPFEMAYAIAEGSPHDAVLHLRGEPSQPGESVPRGFIKVLGGKPLAADAPGSGRLQLAQWLTRDVAHLTARVMVNRIWQFHFGRGLVTTPNDFGVRGMPPTHPELLDELAHDFIRGGWSIKRMHRQIMLSQTYQQASVWPGSEQARTLGRELFVGFERRRLSAEEIRDSILSVSGLLDQSPGAAHPFPPPTTWGYTQHAPFSAVYDHDKRSVFLMTQRLKRHPFLALFDGADPNASTAVRLGTTVPTQALYFMNDPFVHRASLAWADRLIELPTQSERLRGAFQRAFQREPSQAELADAEQFLADYRSAMTSTNLSQPTDGTLPWAAWLRTLIGSNEFLHID